jgi:CubicO group peptidase (beta-lactamase class C family)
MLTGTPTICCSNMVPSISGTHDYWPTHEWLNATPESKGMDSEKLNHLIEVIETQDSQLESVLVIRDGYIVLEHFFSDRYNPYKKHQLLSATKSFTSTLIGIALHEGFISSVDQKMIDFFPDRSIANLDSRKKAITLEHLLTMTEGMQWNELEYHYLDNRNTLKQMWMSTDPIQYLLDQPIDRNPGEGFAYNSGTSILLAGIVEQTTGKDVCEFAEEHLFDVIGIDDYNWEHMFASGMIHAEKGLFLTPRNMARLGYLYLNNGTWDQREVLYQEWISEATRTHIMTPWGQGGAHQWGGYGYQWWTFPEENIYYASGSYEQKIFVCPNEDLVVVFTGEIGIESNYPPELLLMHHIIPATEISEEIDSDENNLNEEPSSYISEYFVTAIYVSFIPGLISLVAVISVYLIVKRRKVKSL